MYKGKRVLALVPARGGSKGIPGKNIRPLAGKPLIAWSIEHGLESRYIDRVVVSTDDVRIARIAKKHGADVPFLRPARLATDKAATMDVVLHALKTLQGAGDEYDFLVLLEPTSPLREAADLDRAIERLINNRRGAESIVGVSQVLAAHPCFDVSIDRKGFIKPYVGGRTVKVIRRQDLMELYFFEGSLYIATVASLLRRKAFYHEKTLPYIVPKWKSPEVDDITDWVCIEAIMKNVQRIRAHERGAR